MEYHNWQLNTLVFHAFDFMWDVIPLTNLQCLLFLYMGVHFQVIPLLW